MRYLSIPRTSKPIGATSWADALEMLQVLWEKGRELEVMEGKCNVEGNGWGRMEKDGQADPVVCLSYDSHEGNKTSMRLGWSPCL